MTHFADDMADTPYGKFVGASSSISQSYLNPSLPPPSTAALHTIYTIKSSMYKTVMVFVMQSMTEILALQQSPTTTYLLKVKRRSIRRQSSKCSPHQAHAICHTRFHINIGSTFPIDTNTTYHTMLHDIVCDRYAKNGAWTGPLLSKHINYKELMVVWKVVTQLRFQGRRLLIYCDNTTILAYVNNEQVWRNTVPRVDGASQPDMDTLPSDRNNSYDSVHSIGTEPSRSPKSISSGVIGMEYQSRDIQCDQ
jgi:hypothetical protein